MFIRKGRVYRVSTMFSDTFKTQFIQCWFIYQISYDNKSSFYIPKENTHQIFFSKYLPSTSIPASKRRRASAQHLHRVSGSTLFHTALSACFNESIELYFLTPTLLSRMDQILKSIGLRSGEQGSHISFGQNPSLPRFSQHHCCILFDV